MLDTEIFSKLLTQVNQENINALMLALFRNANLHTLPLLSRMSKLDTKDQIAILRQKSVSGWNALALAMCKQHQTVRPLLNLIVNLPQEEQIKIFYETSVDALGKAFCLEDDIQDFLLQCIIQLPRKVLINLLKQTTPKGCNVIMFAIQKNSPQIRRLLDFLDTLALEHKEEILTQVTKSGSNMLLLALEYHINSVYQLLNIIKKLTSEKQIKILHQVEDSGWHALARTAATGDISTIRFLMDFIDINFVSQSGLSALFIAAQYGKSEMVKFLLEKGALQTIPFVSTSQELTSFVQSHSKEIQIRMEAFLKSSGSLTEEVMVRPFEIAYIMGHDEIAELLKIEKVYLEEKSDSKSMPEQLEEEEEVISLDFRDFSGFDSEGSHSPKNQLSGNPHTLFKGRDSQPYRSQANDSESDESQEPKSLANLLNYFSNN